MREQQLLQLLPETITLEGVHEGNTLYLNGRMLPLKKSLAVANHSPTGFNWGYGGSGPAQSALAILLEYWPREAALRYYQAFKFGYIAALPKCDFIKTVPLRQLMAGLLAAN